MTDVQSKPLVYLRPSSDGKFPAELCVQGSDEVFASMRSVRVHYTI